MTYPGMDRDARLWCTALEWLQAQAPLSPADLVRLATVHREKFGRRPPGTPQPSAVEGYAMWLCYAGGLRRTRAHIRETHPCLVEWTMPTVCGRCRRAIMGTMHCRNDVQYCSGCRPA